MKMAKYLRLEAGVGQGELAILIGTSQPRVADWENGKTTMSAGRRKAAAAHLRRRSGWPVTADELELDLVEYIRGRMSRSMSWGHQKAHTA